MLPTGTRLGRYELLTALGEGGMGEVYRARDERLGREVAIRVLQSSFSADPDRLRRFEQEARATGAVNHPNVIVVHDTGQHDGAPYVVYELLEGTTVTLIGNADAPLPVLIKKRCLVRREPGEPDLGLFGPSLNWPSALTQ